MDGLDGQWVCTVLSEKTDCIVSGARTASSRVLLSENWNAAFPSLEGSPIPTDVARRQPVRPGLVVEQSADPLAPDHAAARLYSCCCRVR